METCYQLELPTDKKRIFVTQLRDDEDDEEEFNGYQIIRKIPIVKKKAGQLIEYGFNTLQKTLLLKREHDAELFDVQFQKARIKLNERINKCKEDQKKIKEKEEIHKNRVEKFSKFVDENNKKAERAKQKFRKEKIQIQFKLKEIEELNEEISQLTEKCDCLKNTVCRYSKFEKFLANVVDTLPADYLEASDDMVDGLMKRYETLEETSTKLKRNIFWNSEKIDECASIIQNLTYEQVHEVTLNNREVASLKKDLEELRLHNARKEYEIELNGETCRTHSESIGGICLAVENLFQQCKNINDELSIFQKLDEIKMLIKDQESVYNMSNRGATSKDRHKSSSNK